MFCSISANAQVVKGDMNSDDIVDVIDANEVFNTILGSSPYKYLELAGDPFLVDNSRVVGTWYKTKVNNFTLNADGTTNYSGAATYKFFPYQGALIFYDNNGTPVTQITVDVLKDGYMVCVPLSTKALTVLTTTRPAQPVTSIDIMPSSVELVPGQEQVLLATVLPFTADNRTVTYESSNESVVRMDGRKAIAVALGSAIITCRATDGSGVTATCTITVTSRDISGTDANGRKYVDLCLPSGTLWASWNVGASKPEDTGKYFAWGETRGYGKGENHNFNWANYSLCNGVKTKLTKYCIDATIWDPAQGATPDDKTELEAVDDAATVSWGSEWCMPSYEQIKELKDSRYTTIHWESLNDVDGYRITSKVNGNSIFIPVTGFRKDASFNNQETNGLYWTRSLYVNKLLPSQCTMAYYMLFDSSHMGDNFSDRIIGLSVRAVRVAQ